MIRFFNVYTKESVNADTEPMIAALYNSGDMHENATRGQDFGWRLAPEVVVEMRAIKGNAITLQQIAATLNVAVNDITDPIILAWISAHTVDDDAPVASDADFTSEYLAEIARIEEARQAKMDAEVKRVSRRASRDN